MPDPIRLAIVTSHPIQYQAPLWRALASEPGVEPHVFFATRDGADTYFDPDFELAVRWDVSLLDGYPWTVLPNRPLPMLGARFRYRCPDLEPALRAGRFDALLLVGKENWFYLQAIRAARRLGIPILFRAETPPPRRGVAAWLADRQRGRFYRSFAALLCVGREQTHYYRRYGVPGSRLFRSPYGVDNDFFRAAARRADDARAEVRREFDLGPDDRVVAFVGKFTDKKRPLDLVRAAARLPAEARVRLLMVGTGPRLAACRDEAARLGYDGVRFAGFRNQTEVGAIYAAADAFALPSDHGETWGLVVNEAMNFDLPVVVSDRVGCGPELVIEGENGFRYPCGDVEALADRLRRVFAHEGSRRAMGRCSRVIVDGFGIDAAANGVLDALGFVLGRPVHRPAAPRSVVATERAAMKALTLNLGSVSVTGGVERYALDLHRALAETTDRVVSLSLWDTDDRAELVAAGVEPETYQGCGRSKVRFLARLVATLRRERPDVVWLTHVLFLPVLPLVRMLAPRARVVVSAHGIEVWSPRSRLHRWLLRRVDRVVAVTGFTARRTAAAQGLDPDPIAVLPPAMPPGFARAAAEDAPAREDRDERAGRVLTVARLGDDAEGKGIYTAVRAFAAAARDLPDARMTVIGDGSARAALAALAEVLGVGDRVGFPGRVSDEELERAYRTHDIFLLPSRKEGFGIVFVEAMAHGLAVVAGNRDAATEVVCDGETGRLVDPRDAIAVRDVLSALLRDPAGARALGAEGRARVLDRFGPERFRERLLGVLGGLAARAGRPVPALAEEGGSSCGS